MAKNLCLQLDFIEDPQDELNIKENCKEKNNKLNVNHDKLDSNLSMDIAKTKEKSEIGTDHEQNNQGNKRMDTHMDGIGESQALSTVKKITIIEEIHKTVRHSSALQPQFAKNNKSSSDDSKHCVNKTDERCCSAVNLNEEEIKHYFNVHLDHLEDNVRQNLKKDNSTTWKPFELNHPPVIDVVTSLKPGTVLDKELQIHTCGVKPVHITGQVIRDCSSALPNLKVSEKITSNFSSNINKPHLNDINKSSPFKRNDLRDKDIILKDYVNILVNPKKIRENKKMLIKVLKTYFNIWIHYVKYRKTKRLTKKAVDKKEDNSNNIKRKLTKELNPCSLQSPLVLQSLSKSKQNCKPSLKQSSTDKITFKKANVKEKDNLSVLESQTGSKIEIKTITPKEVGLKTEQNNEITKTIRDNETREKQLKPPGKATVMINKEQISHRFDAQVKIIEDLRALVKTREKEIMMLQVQNLEMQNQLKLKSDRGNIATVFSTFDEQHKPAMKTALGRLEKAEADLDRNKPIKKIDKSEMLTKNMRDRQDHCKQLYEMTKMRKIQMEEEKAKEKLKFEGKERERKEEQKRLWLLKIEMEKQFAEENARIALAKKIHINNLTNKAINHHNHVLMKKAFSQLKMLILDITVRADQCAEMYKKKIVRKVFTNWEQKASQAILEKNTFVDTFYNTKLMRFYWNMWRRLQQETRSKIQVSEDMFSLKLQQKTFNKWQKITAHQYLQTCCKMELAERLYRRQLLKHYFRCWKLLPNFMFIDRNKEQRRRAWRETVQQLIPDFSPVFADHFEV